MILIPVRCLLYVVSTAVVGLRGRSLTRAKYFFRGLPFDERCLSEHNPTLWRNQPPITLHTEQIQNDDLLMTLLVSPTHALCTVHKSRTQISALYRGHLELLLGHSSRISRILSAIAYRRNTSETHKFHSSMHSQREKIFTAEIIAEKINIFTP